MFGTTTTSITGNDTVIINNRNLVNLGDGDNGDLKHPNELATVKTGKNGNTLIAYNASGQQGEMTLRVMRGSSDDIFLNALLKSWQLDPAGFFLLTGKFVKRIGDGFGLVRNDTYVLTGGVFFKGVDAKSNAEGDTEQSLALYNFRWGNVMRALL